MGVCGRIYVLDYGTIIAHGNPEEIKNNPKVIEAYLGEEARLKSLRPVRKYTRPIWEGNYRLTNQIHFNLNRWA